MDDFINTGETEIRDKISIIKELKEN